MEKKQQLTEKNLESLQRVNSTKPLKGGTLIAILIAISPYLFYLYESVPEGKTWNTFLFTYNSDLYESTDTAMWILTGKLIPLYLLFIWFFSCRQWWYHSILVPIAMYTYQTISFIQSDTGIFDEFQLMYLIPVMAIIIPSIYLIRARIFNRINEASKSMQELEDELKISPKNFWSKIKEYF